MATPPKEMVERLIREACGFLWDLNSTKSQRSLARRFLNQQQENLVTSQNNSQYLYVVSKP
jgi:hypothetical protein